jgi:hypothetical protein
VVARGGGLGGGARRRPGSAARGRGGRPCLRESLPGEMGQPVSVWGGDPYGPGIKFWAESGQAE